MILVRNSWKKSIWNVLTSKHLDKVLFSLTWLWRTWKSLFLALKLPYQKFEYSWIDKQISTNGCTKLNFDLDGGIDHAAIHILTSCLFLEKTIFVAFRFFKTFFSCGKQKEPRPYFFWYKVQRPVILLPKQPNNSWRNFNILQQGKSLILGRFFIDRLTTIISRNTD